MSALKSDRPAIEGGTPVRADPLPFFRVDVGPAEEREVLAALRSGWLSHGHRTERFESDFRQWVGGRGVAAVSSCTAGLHLLLRAAGIGAGDEVITSAVTFPGTANAVIHAGATPVIADVDSATLTLAIESVESLVTPRTRAILAVHLAGWPARMAELGEVAERHGLCLLEDAAHALGATYNGRPAGDLGDGAAFSFYATKNVTTGEGGMVVSRHEDWLAQVRVERLHGLDVDSVDRQGESYRHWEAISLGWKYNMNDVAAGLGLAQLRRLPEFLTRRRAVDRRYRQLLSELDGVVPLVGPAEAETAAHLFPVLLRPNSLRIGRDEVLRAMLAENIGVGVHFRSLTAHRFFREALGWDPAATPVASASTETVFSLPLDTVLSDCEQDQVVEALGRIVSYYAV